MKLQTIIFSALLALSVGLVACGDDDDTKKGGGDTCSSDNDCKGDRICNSNGACVNPDGSNNGSGNNGSANNGSANNGTSTGGCCLNGQAYTCTSAADAQACFDNGAPGDCSRAASLDGECSSSNNGTANNGTANNGNTGKDVGETCEVNNECAGSVCLVRTNSGDILGYCSERCESFADCPTFWDCEELDNAAGKYCIQS